LVFCSVLFRTAADLAGKAAGSAAGSSNAMDTVVDTMLRPATTAQATSPSTPASGSITPESRTRLAQLVAQVSLNKRPSGAWMRRLTQGQPPISHVERQSLPASLLLQV
jgi:hypothetical protein